MIAALSRGALAAPEATAPPAQGSPKRALPDYDGRAPETTAGEALLWVPRVLLFPAYLASEYLIRRPLGALTVAAERADLVDELRNLFTWGPNHNIGLIPTALIDFGFRASVGVYFFYDDLGVPGNDLRVHAATGGTDWFRLTVADRIPLDDSAHIKLRAEGWTRPDWLYAGVGPMTLESARSRYLARSVEGGLSFHLDLGEASDIETSTSVKAVRFGAGRGDEDPSLPAAVAAGLYPLPPGFADGTTAYRQGLRIAFDTRGPRPEPGSGARLEVHGEHAFDFARLERRRWVRYGASLGGFVDLTGQNRNVGLSVAAAFADPLGADEVPFTELVELGGDAPMRGFLAGRLRGRSALAATLEYRYPIWAFLDGSAQVAVGNVLDAHLRGLDPELLRFSFVFGVRTIGSRDHSFDILIGSATETFAQGAALQDVRFLFGASKGF